MVHTSIAGLAALETKERRILLCNNPKIAEKLGDWTRDINFVEI